MTKKYTLGPWYYEEGHTDSYCVADLGKYKIYKAKGE